MRTAYGRKLVKEASGQKDKNYKRMRQIATEFRKAKVKDYASPKYMDLASEFLFLKQQNDELQQAVTNMVYMESFLRPYKERRRVKAKQS